MTTLSDEETLKRFVLRARRIEAHSLVTDWDQLTSYARGSFQFQLDITGKASVTRHLPADEERFESLAARIRPLTVASEPVHYGKVFDALERLIADAAVAEPVRRHLGGLRAAWAAAELQGSQTQGYAIQSFKLDGTEATPLVSDTQLAAAWLYGDLVHADPIGPKAEAPAFSLTERYAAAVRLFSHLAALTVGTLRLAEHLRDTGALTVGQGAWDGAVVVNTSELVDEAQVLLAAPGTLLPGADERFELGDGWAQVTVTDMLRQDPAKQVRVVLETDDGTAVASYDAAVAHRSLDETTASWNALVGDCAMFQFRLGRDGDRFIDPQFLGCQPYVSTNRLRAASTALLLQMHRAARMRFEVQGHDLLVLGTPTLPAERVLELEVLQQTIDDILTIERLSRADIGVCAGGFDDRDRVRLRRARLLWEGQVVHAMRHPVVVTAPHGAPPELVQVAGGDLNVGGAKVPTLTWRMWHPAMTATAAGMSPEDGPEAMKYEARSPDGEQFLAWAPQLVDPALDESLTITAPWGLLGIDETTFRF